MVACVPPERGTVVTLAIRLCRVADDVTAANFAARARRQRGLHNGQAVALLGTGYNIVIGGWLPT